MIKNLILTLISYLIALHILNAQSKTEHLLTIAPSHFIITKNDTVYSFYAVKPVNIKKAKENKVYYWFKKDTLLKTEGGFDGRILDGVFKMFYPNKNLSESGTFRNGLKINEWKAWYPNGKIQTITNWKNGEKNGLFEEYNIDGTLSKSGFYKNGNLDGVLTEFLTNGKQNHLIFKEGLPVIKKPKAQKDSLENK